MTETVTITVSKDALERLLSAVNGMHEFSRSCQEDLARGDFHDYDYGMTDWREDIADAAEDLAGSIQEVAQ